MKNERKILKPIAIASVLALIFMFVFSFTTFAATDEGKEENTPPIFGEFSPGEGSESLARGDKSQSGSQFGGKERAASGQNGGNSRDGGLVIKERASETGEDGQSGQNGEGEGQFGMTPPEGFTPGGNGGFGGEGMTPPEGFTPGENGGFGGEEMTPPEGFTPGENGGFGFKGGRGGMTSPDGEGFRPFDNTDAGYSSGETDSNSNTHLLIAVIAEGAVIIGLALTLALTLAKKRKQTVSPAAETPANPTFVRPAEPAAEYPEARISDDSAAQTHEQNTGN